MACKGRALRWLRQGKERKHGGWGLVLVLVLVLVVCPAAEARKGA